MYCIYRYNDDIIILCTSVDGAADRGDVVRRHLVTNCGVRYNYEFIMKATAGHKIFKNSSPDRPKFVVHPFGNIEVVGVILFYFRFLFFSFLLPSYLIQMLLAAGGVRTSSAGGDTGTRPERFKRV